MAGYGNKTAPDYTGTEHEETRFDISHSEPYSGGHSEHKSGTVGGAGYGNKKDANPNMDEYDNSDLRFDSHKNTEPYSGGHETYKSGTVGGAGFGNKTGGFGQDSRMGKMMEKVGHMVNNEGLVEKGMAKREAKGYTNESSTET